MVVDLTWHLLSFHFRHITKPMYFDVNSGQAASMSLMIPAEANKKKNTRVSKKIHNACHLQTKRHTKLNNVNIYSVLYKHVKKSKTNMMQQ